MEQTSTGGWIKGNALKFSIDEILKDTKTTKELEDDTKSTIYGGTEALPTGTGYNLFHGMILKAKYHSKP